MNRNKYTDIEIREACERSGIEFKRCEHCQQLYAVMKKGSRFCSSNCRVANHRFWKARVLFKKIVSSKLQELPNYQGYYLQLGLKVDNYEQFEVHLNGGEKSFKGNAKEVINEIDTFLKENKTELTDYTDISTNQYNK